jgi:prevent-host-death family protein
MLHIGIRELKNQAPEIIRQVREEQAEYVVTHRGEPVAVLLPINEALIERKPPLTKRVIPSDELRRELEQLRQEIDQNWQSDKSGVDLLTEMRR